MIYNKLRIFCLSALLVVGQMLFLQSCRGGSSETAGSPEKMQEGSLQLTDSLQEFETERFSFDVLQSLLAPNVYYLGECHSLSADAPLHKSFIVKFNRIDANTFESIMYDITDTLSAVVSPVSMEGSSHLRKVSVNMDGQEFKVKKIMLAKTEDGVKGRFTIQKQSYEFFLKLYKYPVYKEFGNRYLKETYPCRIIRNVKYGQASGYWTTNVPQGMNYFEIFAQGVSSTMKKRDLNLLCDIYLPEDDDLASRPLILFIHGGAFYIGDKADNPIVLWCKHFAACGYVAVSINYRMGFKPSKTSIERCGYRAVQDAHAAVRFLLSKKEEYRINPDYLFVAGSSAGAITSLNLAFMRNSTRPASSRKNAGVPDLGNIESSGNSLKQDFHICAVANMWGALNSLDMLAASKTSVISFHGDADKVVPYDSGIPFSDMEKKVQVNKIFFDKMYGSASIHRKAQQLGYRSELHTFKGLGHAPHVDEANQPTSQFYFIQEHITDFFFQEFIPKETGVRRDSANPRRFRLDGNGIKEIRWKVEGGFILGAEGNSVRVVFVEGISHSLKASAVWENGAAGVFHADL